MTENNIITILKSLNKGEIKDFRIFIGSSFFNTNKNLVCLFEILCNELQIVQKLDTRQIHKTIYGSKPHSEENVKTLIHQLTRLLEKFLAYNEYTKAPGEEKVMLMRAYDNKKLDKLYNRLQLSYGNELEEIKGFNLTILYRKMWYEKSLIDFYVNRDNEKLLHQAEVRLSEITIAIFFIEMFRQYNMFWRLDYIDFETDNNYVTPVLDNIDIEAVNKLFSETMYKYYMLFEPYYCLHRSIDDDSEVSDKFIERFMELIGDENSQIEKSEQFVLSTILVNFLYLLFTKDFARYERRVFEAFRLLLSLYSYSGEKYLRTSIFKNILRFGVQLKEYEWIQSFINEYTPMLEENERNNMYNYAWCFLSFAIKDYEGALKYESKIDYGTTQMKYYMRDVRLCALYELGDYEGALNLIDAYKHFIKNEKSFKGSMKTGYIQFIQMINELVKFKLGKSRITTEKLKEKINISVTMRKRWLLAKAEQL